MKTGHAIPLTPQKRLMVFAGRSHPALASRIVERLGVALGEIELTTFGTARRTAAIASRPRRGRVPVQTGCRPRPEHMELLFMIRREAGVRKRITAVIPLFPTRARIARRSARADLEPPARDMSRARRRPRSDDGSARRADPGSSRSGRPHDRAELFARTLPRLGFTVRGRLVAPAQPLRAPSVSRDDEADFANEQDAPRSDAVAVTEVTGRVRDKICIVGTT